MTIGRLLTPMLVLLWGCASPDRAPAGPDAAVVDVPDVAVVDAPDAAVVVDAPDAAVVDVPEVPGPVELGTGAERWEPLPRDGGELTLVHGPQ
ncbi:MAG: hypothetical protein KA978_29470, partial [Deltaproteobacteria bacterium]|nr:hypothetical protein [Deltaproteobacteria bacterium]